MASIDSVSGSSTRGAADTVLGLHSKTIWEDRESTLPDVGVPAWLPLTPLVEAAQGAQRILYWGCTPRRYGKTERAHYLT